MEGTKSMRFDCINNQFVELSILGYEFPEITDKADEWNRNWLFVHINVKSNEKQWNKTHPSITTFELKRLIDWFRNISENISVKYSWIDFLEPNISFELTNNYDSNIKNIKIHLWAEFHPFVPTCANYRTDSATDAVPDYCIEFNATNEQLKNYANELEIELKKYPERVK